MPMLGMYRTLPNRLPAHPGGPTPGPIAATTLPQRAGMAVQGPIALGSVPDRPFGMTMPQPSGGGMLQNGRPRVFPGSGSVFYRDDEYNPSVSQRRIDDAGVARDQMYGGAAGSGPYDSPSALGRFQSLDGPAPLGPMGKNRIVVRDTNGAPNSLNMAYRERADNKAAGLREGRRNRMIFQGGRYGPLTWLQPTNQYAYNPQTNGYDRAPSVFGGASPGMSTIVSRHTPIGEDGTPGPTNWGNVARSMYDDPKFKGNPKAAWDEIRKSGMSSADVQALIDDASGAGLFNLQDKDPAFIAWVQGLGQAAGIQGPAPAPGYFPPGQSGQQGSPRQPGGIQFNPFDPFGSVVGMLPDVSIGFNPANPFNPFPVRGKPGPQRTTPPPPTPPQRRPGPAFQPNF